MGRFIEYRDLIDAFSVDFAPDNYLRLNIFRRCLSAAHKDWNEAKKNIQLYQAAIEHWKTVIRSWPDLVPPFKCGSEIKQLKKELGELQSKCRKAKAYYKRACGIYMSYIEFCKQ